MLYRKLSKICDVLRNPLAFFEMISMGSACAKWLINQHWALRTSLPAVKKSEHL